MINFYCCGIYPLMNVLSSNLLNENDFVRYIVYQPNGHQLPDGEVEKYLVEKICHSFNINFEISPIITEENSPLYIINDGDYISENLIILLRKQIRNLKIICVSEGASGLRHLFYDSWWLKGEVLNNRNFQYLVFDDIDSVIYKMKKYNVITINYNYLKLGREKIKKVLSESLSFNFDKFQNIFTPFLLEDLETQKQKLLNIVGSEQKILIKKHPSDFRNYDIFKDNPNFEFLSNFYNQVPVELFFLNSNTKYFGYYATAILSVRFENMNIISCNSNEAKLYLKKAASYLYKIYLKREKHYYINK